jgi:hypothetical protein
VSPQSSNHPRRPVCSHPQALPNTSSDCLYSCTELTVYFKARLAIEPTSLPSCTFVPVDRAPNSAAFVVNATDNEVVLGNPNIVRFGRRVEVNAAHAALRYIKLGNLTAPSAQGGGAILAQSSTVTLYDCVLEGNRASRDGAEGGAILVSSGKLVVERAIFRGNFASRGGAIASVDSIISVASSVFQSNNATMTGGALHVNLTVARSSVSVDLRYVQFAHNYAGSASHGDAVMLRGVSRWAGVNLSYIPFDALRTVETQGMSLVSCDESDYATCQPGHGCTYGLSTLHCSPCQPNCAQPNPLPPMRMEQWSPPASFPIS